MLADENDAKYPKIFGPAGQKSASLDLYIRYIGIASLGNNSPILLFYISWSILRLTQNPCSKLKKRRLVMTPLSNFAEKLPTTAERRYSVRHRLELFKTVRLAFIGSIVVEISYKKVP